MAKIVSAKRAEATAPAITCWYASVSLARPDNRQRKVVRRRLACEKIALTGQHPSTQRSALGYAQPPANRPVRAKALCLKLLPLQGDKPLFASKPMTLSWAGSSLAFQAVSSAPFYSPSKIRGGQGALILIFNSQFLISPTSSQTPAPRRPCRR